MRESQGGLNKKMTDAQPEPEVDVEATEDSSISEAEAEEFETTKLKAELEEMEDKYLRVRAEIANMANRGRNEREQLQKYRPQDLAKKLLSSIDNLERALTTEVSDGQGAGLKKGVETVSKGLRNALEEEGIGEILAKGEAFDPSLHQAVQTVPTTEDTPADTIAEILQGGYKLYDRVLRPTMVIVAQ